MKAIIVAAGPGSRLLPITDHKPKCLLDIGGMTIMQRALQALRDCGVSDITVVRGYMGRLISYPSIKYYENTDYLNNNILKSLFYAEAEINSEFIFSYSDILYDRNVVQKLIDSPGDVSIVVDTDWLSHYEGRDQHPVAEAELVTVEDSKVTRIGKDTVLPDEAYGEFIGLAKLSQRGAGILKETYDDVLGKTAGGMFQRAASIDKAYLTDMLQELIDRGYLVGSVDIEGGWQEIDTPQDLDRARRRYS